jgi:hypothetical protein
MISEAASEPKLDKPGAGLPAFEWLLARYLIFPYRFATSSKEKAITDFVMESEKVVTLIAPIPSHQLSERRLIARLRGMEDSSRFWSVAMAVEHLISSGTSARRIILDLSNGGTQLPHFKIADIKPSAQSALATLQGRFTKMSQDFVSGIANVNIGAHPEATYPHPWFGPLNACQWLTFVAPHQRIHRQQIEAIIALLD